MSLGQFTTRSLSGVPNLAGEFAVNITTEHLRYVLPANFNPEAWAISIWFIPDWDNTDGLRHFIASLYLNDDNHVDLEKDAAGDLVLTYVGSGQSAVTVSRTVAFSSGTPVFVGIAVDGTGFQAPSFARRYIYLAADQNGDGSLEYVFDGFFGSLGEPLIDPLIAGDYTLHVGSDFAGGFSLDGAISIAITNDQDNTPISDRFNGGQGLPLLGSENWIVKWCERLVIALSGEASGNLRADTWEGSIDLMDAEDDGTGKLEFGGAGLTDHDWVEFGDTDIFDGLAAGTFFFDFLNGQTSQAHLLAGRFPINPNNGRQWIASFASQGELEFSIAIDPSPGGENGNMHTTGRWALLNQRIAWIVRYDGSQPDDFGPTGKMRAWISYFSSVGSLQPPNTGVFNPEQMWTPFRELDDLQNTGTGPFPTTFKSAIGSVNYRWGAFSDQTGLSPFRGDFNDLRFNLLRALDPAEIEAMNPSAFIRSQWTHRWGMKLNAAGEVSEDLGSGLDGELMSVSGDGPDEASDRSFVQGQFPEVVTEGVFAFNGDGDLILTTDPGDEADIELTRLSLPGDGSSSGGNRVETANDSAFDVLTGDLDLRMDIRRDSFSDGPTQFNQQFLIVKLDGGPNDRTFSWVFSSFGTFNATLYRTDGNEFSFFSTIPLPKTLDGKRIWIRATFDLDDGLGNRVATWMYSETWDGVSADDGETWTVHEIQTIAGAEGPLDASPGSAMEVGASRTNQFPRLRADVFRAQVRDGIDGTIVWDPDFEAQTPGATSFTEDANGLTVDLVQVGDPHVQIANGIQRATWGWWGRIGRISPVVETIFGRWDGTDNQFRIARNGADVRVYISSGGASEDDFADFVLGMQAGERWKFIVVYVGSGPYAYPQLDPPRGIRISLYAYLFNEVTGLWGSRQEPAASYTGLIPQQLVPSAVGYIWAKGEFAGEVDETRVWNDAELDQLEADQETVYS